MSASGSGAVFYGQKDMQETDGQLLIRFAKDRDDAAFNALASRYLGLIYHTALRRSGSRPLAEEVSQNVLCAVAKKASSLARHPERLPAWLHRATLFESSKAMRSEASHHRRSQLRHPDEIGGTGNNEAAWLAALPHLDPALDRLSESDRVVVLQHYFEGWSFRKIAEQQARPAATVQKQCRRAIDKLSRMLRGKGVAITAAALASGLGTQLAKAAPASLLKTAAGSALAGASTHSTTHLTLFMAMKSKAVLPLTLLVLASPLVVQQLAISRVVDQNERLRFGLTEMKKPIRPNRTLEGADVGLAKHRITIDDLQRAYAEAQRLGVLKRIEFEEMLASLSDDELAELIPQVFGLRGDQSKKSNLLRELVTALAKIDSERAVRVACSAVPGKPLMLNVGVEKALYDWTSKSPGEAIDWLKELSGEFPGLGSSGDTTWLAFKDFQAAVAGALILEDSPRVREVMGLVPGVHFHYLIRDAMDFIAPERSLEPDMAVDRFAKFLPLIREYVPGEAKNDGYGRVQAIGGLLWACNAWPYWQDSQVPGRIMETVDLLPSERRVIAEAYAATVVGNYYDHQPRPERTMVESAAMTWLERHVPNEADEIFEMTKATLHDRERREIENQLRSISQREVLRDDDLVRELGRRDFGEFTEFRAQALELAQKIKDPVKRAEIIQTIENP
ncbi:RNA polymerase sigma factor [Haloferula chungangensis]|uniref:RNA polymerase sigma factor n=1 Tax=Haloferula chungangensis TaxID=1048331 RepID=A0ABW2L7Q1_9BACT